MNKIYLFLGIAVLTYGCGPKPSNEASEVVVDLAETSHHNEGIKKVFDAHGGFDRWYSMKSLTYFKGGEKTVVNLRNRKIRVASDKKTIGFDGENVWVTPDTVEVGNARFYHNLFFYFYCDTCRCGS